jgi:alcohol dehydrogenase class IV
MAHATGGIARVPHGVANAILLPHGMEYNFEVCKQKYAELLPFMGVDGSGLSVEEAARMAIEAVRSLGRQLSALDAIPTRLRDTGVSQEILPQIAEAAVEDGTIVYNPREVVAEEILKHLEAAY